MVLDRALSEKISIVIIARNRVHSLGKTLHHLTSLHPSVPIIMVDNCSEDHTIQYVNETYPEVDLLCLTKNYGSAGRNVGVARARTPYIAFADDDSWWEERALETAIALFEQYPRLGLIQGKILLHGEQIEPACQLMEQSPVSTPPHFPGKYILGFIACGAIIRKEAFLSVGGFHHQFGVGGEEELMALDLAEQGWELAYIQDILAFHDPSPVRDRSRRKQLSVRNHLWSVWLRRPLRSIGVETWSLFRRAMSDRNVCRGLCEAVAGLPWILAERKPLSSEVELEVARLARFCV